MRITALALALAFLLPACSSGPSSGSSSSSAAQSAQRRSLGIVPALIPPGRYGRHRVRTMQPRYITVHSTQNYSRSADARAHADLLRAGKLTGENNSLGYLTWHYTVDANSIYQSLPDHEQGQHADYEGPGNRSSVGIEMCENRGNSRSRTLDRTARLIALLMREHNIPLSRVVPHYHWRRVRYSDRADLGHKDCPHFLLDNGKPGPKWRAFLATVDRYYRQS
jgi:N-acetylmuramoyl-L-alanine amidase